MLLINNLNLVTAEAWQSLGEIYYFGNNQKKDYALSRACYEHAIGINPKHADSLCMLGFLYQQGLGISKDLDKARKYYESAAQENHYEAKKQYLLMVNFELDAAQWSDLGHVITFQKMAKNKIIKGPKFAMKKRSERCPNMSHHCTI